MKYILFIEAPSRHLQGGSILDFGTNRKQSYVIAAERKGLR